MLVWAVANQKGGVGKTTTTLCLGRELAQHGQRVLLIDLDPHASLSCAFGVPAQPPPPGVLELFATPAPSISQLLRHSAIAGLDYLCAQAGLATLERRSASQPGLGRALQQALQQHSGQHDMILLDCAPTLGLLMINALAAADRLIIPAQTEPLALYGLDSMLRTAAMVQHSRQRALPVSILPTRFDRRTRASMETLQKLYDNYGAQVCPTPIALDTRLTNPAALTVPLPENENTRGRGLNAYQQVLNWLSNAPVKVNENKLEPAL